MYNTEYLWWYFFVMPGAVRLPASLNSATCMVRVCPAVRPRPVRCQAWSTSQILFFPGDPIGVFSVSLHPLSIPHHVVLHVIGLCARLVRWRRSHSTYSFALPSSPADTKRSINVGLAFVKRRRRWTNVKPTLIQRLVSAGCGHSPPKTTPVSKLKRSEYMAYKGPLNSWPSPSLYTLEQVNAAVWAVMKSSRQRSLTPWSLEAFKFVTITHLKRYTGWKCIHLLPV